MASSFVDGTVFETHKRFNHTSPKNTKKFLSPKSDHDHHHHADGVPYKCVCAPSTHAGSFKCRLHRVNSHGHSPRSPSSQQQASVSDSSSKTVTACELNGHGN